MRRSTILFHLARRLVFTKFRDPSEDPKLYLFNQLKRIAREWLDGFAVHLENHDVGLVAVSRAPIDQIQAYKRRMDWTFRWASSHDTDFNYDFNTSFTEDQQRSGDTEYNYAPRDMRGALEATQPSPHAAMAGTDNATFMREAPGMSAFALENGVVYHTYSAYARGLDSLWGMYQWLDRAPLGRNENGAWFRHHVQY